MSDNLKPCEICERANCSADLHFPPTLRDQFAMAALSIIASDMHLDATYAEVAKEAYSYADEMLATREKKS